MPGLSDACLREADWLNTYGDGLPALPVAGGGPWDVVQAYWPGNRLNTSLRGIYVTWRRDIYAKPNAIRTRPQVTFLLKLVWAIKTTTPPVAETEQANFADAIQDILARAGGPMLDKTHGGRFLSVGETPGGRGWPTADMTDPEQTIVAQRCLRGSVTYPADDLEINA